MMEDITTTIDVAAISGDRKPYDKQENETAKAYAAFCAYRDMAPDRSYKKLAEQTEYGPNYHRVIERWSSKYNWAERCHAYDSDQEKIKRAIVIQSHKEEHKAKIERVRRTQEELGNTLVTTAAQMLAVCQARIKEALPTPDKPKAYMDLEPKDVAAWLRSATSAAELGSRLRAESLAIQKLIETMTENGEF